MATAAMPDVEQQVPHAVDHENGTSQEETQETTAQEEYNDLPDASLHDCRVVMVPLKDIYVESDPHDEDLVTALADSIAHIGLQNPICVVKNDLPENDTPYRIVSGRQRYQAYKSLGREYIPCHMLMYDEEAFADERKRLAQYEENLLRKHLTLIETCTLIGKAKAAYLTMYPETGQGKASPKNPGTGRIPYTRVASQRLGKSKSTIEKYVQIYEELIAPSRLEALHAVEHPILERVEDLSALAKRQDDIPALVEILCQDSDTTGGTFCSLHDAQQQLQRHKDAALCRQHSRTDTAAHAHTDAAASGVLPDHAPARSAEGMPRPERHTSPPPQALAAAATGMDLQDLIA